MTNNIKVINRYKSNLKNNIKQWLIDNILTIIITNDRNYQSNGGRSSSYEQKYSRCWRLLQQQLLYFCCVHHSAYHFRNKGYTSWNQSAYHIIQKSSNNIQKVISLLVLLWSASEIWLLHQVDCETRIWRM